LSLKGTNKDWENGQKKQPNPLLFDKHNVVATNNAVWFTWSRGQMRRGARCFVANYLEKHPEELKKTDLFYLAVIDNPQTSVWYKKTLMGKNDNKTMKEKSRLKDFCPEKKLTDHSVRQDQSEEIEKLQYSKM